MDHPVPYSLTLLGDVRFNGAPITGARTRDLLALLAAAAGREVRDTALIDALWPDAPPANPTKALQVVVSRARAATRSDAIVRTPRGYRLGLASDEVDVLALAALADRSQARFAAGDLPAAQAAAESAMALAASYAPTAPESQIASRTEAPGPLAAVRRIADEALRGARRLAGITRSAAGEHESAVPLLEATLADNAGDEAAWASLLRSEAATRGAATALARYERYRRRLADTTGSDPGPELQRIQAELLAADHPVRGGVKFDATDLLGRDDDVRALRTLLQTSRIVSIVGPGGLGKTRLAHVIGRGATQPVVQLVELAGVSSPDDVVGEIGSVLGVRTAVATGLTPEQRADLRSRIAAQLDRVPTLLIVDNCEHVISAAAEIAAFLAVSTRDLRILTTSRTPLNVAGERVYPLGQLGPADAAELFRQRAIAVRPDADLPDDAVTEVVARLDGLPLAIELAAAQIRVMSARDVAARLSDRFALLRGGDRSAPDRHRTLLAVIDWSWNLLHEADRRALRWVSVFHDGCTLDAAESVLGDDALSLLTRLVEQSLVTVRDSPSGTRYAMLETVREFGRRQLTAAGEEGEALAAQSRWARDYARRAGIVLATPDQFTSLDLLRAEESNLSDVLRRSLTARDRETAVIVLAALVGYWSVRGEHERVLALGAAVDGAFAGWLPPADLVDDTRLAMAGFATNWMFMGDGTDTVVWQVLRAVGSDSDDRTVRAITTVILACDPQRGDRSERVWALCADPEPAIASHALMLYAHDLENAGDPVAAIDTIGRALDRVPGDIGPWLPTVLGGRLAELCAQVGRYDEAARHARSVLPTLERLDAADDIVDMHSLLALAALAAGRVDDAQHELDVIDDVVAGRATAPMLAVVLPSVVAELAVARGDYESGLRTYRDAVAAIRQMRFVRGGEREGPGSAGTGSAGTGSTETGSAGTEPTGTEPWILHVGAAALAAHAQYGSGSDGAELFDWLSESVTRLLTGASGGVGNHAGSNAGRSGGDVGRGGGDLGDYHGEHGAAAADLDFPVAGMALVACALWGLAQKVMEVDDAIRLGVLGNRFGYSRRIPSMAWEHVIEAAERAAPGRLAAIEADYGSARGPDLLHAAADFVIPVLHAATPDRRR